MVHTRQFQTLQYFNVWNCYVYMSLNVVKYETNGVKLFRVLTVNSWHSMDGWHNSSRVTWAFHCTASSNRETESHAAETRLWRSLSLSYQKKHCHKGPCQSFVLYYTNYHQFSLCPHIWKICEDCQLQICSHCHTNRAGTPIPWCDNEKDLRRHIFVACSSDYTSLVTGRPALVLMWQCYMAPLMLVWYH